MKNITFVVKYKVMTTIEIDQDISFQQYQMIVNLIKEKGFKVREDTYLSKIQKQELQKRAEEIRKNPNIGIPYEDVESRIKGKYGF